MKKLIIVLAVGMIAADGMAQTGKLTPPPPPEVKDMPMMPATPPPPPEAVAFTPPKIVKNPPSPPQPPVAGKIKFTPPVIVNEKGYAILVQNNKLEPMVLVTKKGLTQKIRMSVWNAKPEYFENKYGKLPPPALPVK